ncbi:hypothetical protein IK110_03820 [Candidatus Saccharibacteria bacterium]|nr:hypothetical protein [Candidatus Saccharibacteria bacterium]
MAQTFVSAATNSANLFAVYDQKHNTVSGKLHIFDYFKANDDVVLDQNKINLYKACENYVNSTTSETNRYGITFHNNTNNLLKCLRHDKGKNTTTNDGHRIFGDVDTYSIGIERGFLTTANKDYSSSTKNISIDIVSQDAAYDRLNKNKKYDLIFHISNIRVHTGTIDDVERVKARDKKGNVVYENGKIKWERNDKDTAMAIMYGRKTGGHTSFGASTFYLHQHLAVGVRYDVEIELIDNDATTEEGRKPKKSLVWMLADIDIGERLYDEDSDTEKERKRYTYYQGGKYHYYAEHVKLISGGLKIGESEEFKAENDKDVAENGTVWHQSHEMIPVSMVKGKVASNPELKIAPDGAIYHQHLTHASNNYVPSGKYSGNVTDNSTDALFKLKLNDPDDPFKIEWGGSGCGTLITNAPYEDSGEDFYYNYELKPYVTNYLTRAAYIGSSVTMNPGVVVMMRKDTEISGGGPDTYATITKETEVKYSYYFTDKSGNLKGSVQTARETEVRRFNDEKEKTTKYDTNEEEALDPITVGIGDGYSVGDRVCIELSVFPFESHDGKNDTAIARKETSGITTRRKTASCLTIAKRPTMSVESSNVYSASSINTSSYDKLIDSTKYSFGSWSEYGVYGRVNQNLLMASGAAFGYDRSGYTGGKTLNTTRNNPGDNGNVATANNSNGCTFMTQTFANADCSQGDMTRTIGGTSVEQFRDRILERYEDDSSAPALIGVTQRQFGNLQYMDLSNIDPTANAFYNSNHGFASVKAGNIYISKTPTFASNDRAHNHTIVYHATNLVIDGDLNNENTKTMAQPWDLTGVIIIADNVYLTDRVNYVNATIIADEVNTCAFQSSNPSLKLKMSDLGSSICNKSVIFDQPVVIRRLILNRTAGANSGSGSIVRSEVFNLNSGNYLWSYNQMSRYSQAITSSTRELPSRY